MENVNAPKKRGPKREPKSSNQPSSSSSDEKSDLDRLAEILVAQVAAVMDRLTYIHTDLSTMLIRYLVDSGDVANKVVEKLSGPYFLLLGVVVLTMLASMGSCMQTNTAVSDGTLLPYPSEKQTCIVQNNTIAGCFANVE